MDNHATKQLELKTSMNKQFDQTNLMWNQLIKLIITLSTTLLFGSAAFFSTIFLKIDDVPIVLIASWVCFFVTLILGIATFINEIIFMGNNAKITAEYLSFNINKLKVKNKDYSINKIKPDKLYISNSIWWGVLSINFFLFSSLLLASGLLLSFNLSAHLAYSFLCLGVILIIIMNSYFLRIRKK